MKKKNFFLHIRFGLRVYIVDAKNRTFAIFSAPAISKNVIISDISGRTLVKLQNLRLRYNFYFSPISLWFILSDERWYVHKTCEHEQELIDTSDAHWNVTMTRQCWINRNLSRDHGWSLSFLCLRQNKAKIYWWHERNLQIESVIARNVVYIKIKKLQFARLVICKINQKVKRSSKAVWDKLFRHRDECNLKLINQLIN